MELHIFDAETLCRACSKKIIMENTGEYGEESSYVNINETPKLLSKLSECISKEFASTDKYSKYLCYRCLLQVNEFYQFRQMCAESMSRFEQLKQHQKSLTFEEVKPIPMATELYIIKEDCEEAMRNNILELGDGNILNEGNKGTLEDIENTTMTMEESVGTVETAKTRVSFTKNMQPYNNIDDSDSSADVDANNDENNSQAHAAAKRKYNTRKKLKNANSRPQTTDDEMTKKAHTYRCDVCPARFTVEDRLKSHKRKHEGLKPYPCTHEGCNKSYSRNSALSEHLHQQHNCGESVEYACDQEHCDRVYKYKTALVMHKRKHHKLGPELKKHICEICGKVCKTSTLLNDHRYTHKDKSERPYECDQPNCTLRFANKDKLKVHLMRHAGIKNYICPYCSMRKTTMHELKVHINYHTLERTWPCRFCSKVCYSSGNLRTHIRTVHECAKDYACRYCDRKFAKPDTRKYHEMTHTGEKPNVCPECGKGFIQPAALRTHRKVHERQRARLMLTKNESKKQE